MKWGHRQTASLCAHWPPGYESDDGENRNLMPHPDLCVSSCFAETNRNQHAQHVEHDVGKMLDVLFTLVKRADVILSLAGGRLGP